MEHIFRKLSVDWKNFKESVAATELWVRSGAGKRSRMRGELQNVKSLTEGN